MSKTTGMFGCCYFDDLEGDEDDEVLDKRMVEFWNVDPDEHCKDCPLLKHV